MRPYAVGQIRAESAGRGSSSNGSGGSNGGAPGGGGQGNDPPDNPDATEPYYEPPPEEKVCPVVAYRAGGLKTSYNGVVVYWHEQRKVYVSIDISIVCKFTWICTFNFLFLIVFRNPGHSTLVSMAHVASTPDPNRQEDGPYYRGQRKSHYRQPAVQGGGHLQPCKSLIYFNI